MVISEDRHDRELLLIQRPESSASNKQRNECQHTIALNRGNELAAQDDDEVGNGCRRGHDDDHRGEVAAGDDTREDQKNDEAHASSGECTDHPLLV